MPFDLMLLPPLNATLNGIAAILLACGFVCIRRKNAHAHRTFMISAFAVSCLFLASYLTYHFNHMRTDYGGAGPLRAIYLTILFSHIVLAAIVPPMAIAALYQAARRRFDRHKKITRWLLPIWFYVSITGVIIYLMLRPYYPV